MKKLPKIKAIRRDAVYWIYPHRDKADDARRIAGAQEFVNGRWRPVVDDKVRK